jgi:hypothetical protein
LVTDLYWKLVDHGAEPPEAIVCPTVTSTDFARPPDACTVTLSRTERTAALAPLVAVPATETFQWWSPLGEGASPESETRTSSTSADTRPDGQCTFDDDADELEGRADAPGRDDARAIGDGEGDTEGDGDAPGRCANISLTACWDGNGVAALLRAAVHDDANRITVAMPTDAKSRLRFTSAEG